jgi:hypothetical protein
MMLEGPARLVFFVLLGPVAAVYGFLFDPGAPPQIFAAQFEQSFGRPPPQIIPRAPTPKPHKTVVVTRN